MSAPVSLLDDEPAGPWDPTADDTPALADYHAATGPDDAYDPHVEHHLAMLRGDIIGEDALRFVQSVRASGDVVSLAPDLAEALAVGDARHPPYTTPERYQAPSWADDNAAAAAATDPATTEAFAALHPDALSPVDRLAASALSTAAIRSLPPPEWLVDGYLVRDSLALLYGPSGTYKTFLGVDIALHLATGSWWNKRAVTGQGRTLYVIAEGVSGVGSRIDAWQRHHRIYDLDAYAPITWLPRAVNLTDGLQVAALCELAGRLEPDLVIVDTLARCTLGAEENSARDMGVVVEHLDRIRRATAACVLSIHHTGKDTTSGARGSSALRAAMDTELEVRPDPLELKVTKQKDAAEAAPARLTPLPVQLDDDHASLVLIPSSQLAQGDAIGANDALVLAALEAVTVPGGVPTGTWLEASGVVRRSFFYARGRLVAKGLVLNHGTERQPRYAPATPVADGQEGDE